MPLVEMQSGVGDEEADRWTADLQRIIGHYAASKQWTVAQRALVASPAGVRRAVLEIRGTDAYGRLHWLHGIHRVQREELAPHRRIRTSTAAVLVTPLDAAESPDGRPSGDHGGPIEKIRTCNYAQDRITDHRIGLTLCGLDQLVEAHLDQLADALDASDLR